MVPSESAKHVPSRFEEPAAKSPDSKPVRSKKGRSINEKQIVAAEQHSRRKAKQDVKVEPLATSPKNPEPVATDSASDDLLKNETVLVNADRSNSSENIRTVSKATDKRANESEKQPERFFEKTSEIIEGRQAEPDEVRTIVMREVQEWVAAAPVEATPEGEIMSSDDRLAEKPKSASLMVRQSDPVVSIAEKPSTAETKLETENAPAAEEHFELSIGTISVIIEGDEKPGVQNELPPRPEQSRTTSTERAASSLLERSYL